MTTYTAKNVLLQLEDGTKVLPYTDKTSRGMENINTSGEDKLIASEVYKDGILSDVRGAETLEVEKRSTFDKSKFTVVGSPSIIDGVASGFSNNDYMYGNTTDVVSLVKQSDNWSITCKTNTKNLSSNIPIFSFGGTSVYNDYPMAYINTYGTMKLRIRPTGTTATTELNWGGVKSFLASNENILVTISYQNGRYKGLLVKEDGTEYSFDYGEYSNTEFAGNYAHFTVFNGNSESVGIIDLKQFSITADGVEVFNGNKTGIDQIKKDDYTVINNGITIYAYVFTDTSSVEHIIYANSASAPTTLYNADGSYYTGTDFTVASSVVSYQDNACTYTSAKNKTLYLSISEDGVVNAPPGITNDNLSVACIPSAMWKDLDNWHLHVEKYCDFNPAARQDFMYLGDFSYGKLFYHQVWNAIVLEVYDTENTGIFIAIESVRSKFKPGDLAFDLYYSSETGYYFTVTQIGIGTQYESSKSTNTNKLRYSNNYLLSIRAGVTDLNKVKFYSNNNLIYQPTLRIPYTYSKTGNKIVDANYRDRVQDMHEQFGYAHYYTLGDVPEKYNVSVVGSPTLVGGIASGFSNTSYLTFKNPFNTSSNFEFKCKLKTPTSWGLGSCIIMSWKGDSESEQSNPYINTSGYLRWCLANDSSSSVFRSTTDLLLSVNTEYYIKASIIDGVGFLGYSVDDINYISVTESISYDFSNTGDTWYIGKGATKNEFMLTGSSIDLSQFSITVDGKEVFRAYDPVISNAYTIPTNSPNDIIYLYKDENNNSYVQRANLTVEQFGNLAANTTSATFPVPFKDTNYTLIVEPADSTSTANPTVGQVNGVRSTTGFTTLTMADKRTYKAKGKIVLG